MQPQPEDLLNLELTQIKDRDHRRANDDEPKLSTDVSRWHARCMEQRATSQRLRVYHPAGAGLSLITSKIEVPNKDTCSREHQQQASSELERLVGIVSDRFHCRARLLLECSRPGDGTSTTNYDII